MDLNKNENLLMCDIGGIQQLKSCQEELDKILLASPDNESLKKYFMGFINLYKSFLTTKSIAWENIKPVSQDQIIEYTSLPEIPAQEVSNLLKRLVVVKLNGGLGTTMGCSFPKSLITVREGLTFLDIILVQLNALNTNYGSAVPLVLMNSFSTDSDTKKVIRKYSNCNTKIYTFLQSQYPRISGDTLMPICNPKNNDDNTCWYPPGHGNFYEAFYESGLMGKFLEEGRDIIFVSNIDNLGAVVDFKILQAMAVGSITGKNIEFAIEVTSKTKNDVKGGTLITTNGKVRLLEIAQVPKEHVEDFKSISNFKVFNTNNVWMNIRKVIDILSKKPLDFDVINNRKTLADGSNIIQLETALGAAIVNFNNSYGINVSRSRFLPVKNNSDLLLIMSNLYDLVNGQLVMSKKRDFQTTPLIQLSGPYFRTVKEFMERFSDIPDILELDYLSVSGDVKFDKNVSLKGTVIVLAQYGDHIDIPKGSVLENKIISGNLRILDH